MDIRNSISLQDRVTPTLRSILKSMDSTLRVMKNLDRASNNGMQSKAYKRAEKDIKRANNELIKMGNYTRVADNAATKAAGSYNRLGASVSSVGRGMQSVNNSASHFLQTLASGVYLAQRLANGIEGIMTTSDTSRSQVARLGLYNTSSYSNQELYGQVFDTAMKTRSDLTDTADLVNKLLISGVYTGPSATQAAIGTAGIINKALIAGGGTSQENERALKQLTQGLASGALQGDELRSIREQTPYFAQVLAEGLAQVDDKFKGIGIGDLKELGAQGELTADRIVKAMWAMQDEINEDFEAMPKTFGQAITSLTNIWEYFLFLISGADGPLGKINDRLWQFVDYLQSPQGLDLLETVAIGINAITTAISWAMSKVGEFVVYLQENAPVAQALFIALGTVAVAAGVQAAIAWISACWPILLVAAAAGLVAYAFLDAGYTAQEFVGGLVGGIYWIVAALWDLIVWIGVVVMWIGLALFAGLTTVGVIVAAAVLIVIAAVMYTLAVILSVLIVIGAALLLAIQGALQLVTWAVMAIVTALWFIWTIIETVFLLGKIAVQGFVTGVVSLFYGLAQTVLGIMNIIAKAIDAVFGSNLAATVSGWSGTLEGKFTAFVEKNDATKTLDDIGQTWKDFGSGVKGMFTSEDLNLYDEMRNLDKGTGDLLDGLWDLTNKGGDALGGAVIDMWNGNADLVGGLRNFGTGATDSMIGSLINLNGAYGSGYGAGSGLVDQIGDITLGSGDNLFDPKQVEVKGGDLDSIGSINSDVNISDEDLQLLRDMAARDYLLQLQTITPVAHVTFGDVRETADVSKIVEVIEQMVEEQMATSLVS